MICADRGYVLFTGLLPLVLGGLIRFVPAKEGLAGAPGTNLFASELLQIMVTRAGLAGTACSIRELVKERPIYTRERAAGLSSGGCLFSKVLLPGFISVVQPLVIVLLGLAGRRMPPHGVVFRSAPAWGAVPRADLGEPAPAGPAPPPLVTACSPRLRSVRPAAPGGHSYPFLYHFS